MKYKIPTLKTKRLILKKGSYADYVKVYEYDFSRLRNIDDEFEFVKNNSEKLKGYDTYSDKEENVLDFIIYLKDKQPIGNIIYDRYDKKNNSIDVSFNMHPNYWHNGYMYEALLYSMNYVFNNLNIDNIVYSYAEDNYKSKGLNKKIGFIYQNDYIEHYIRINKDIKEIRTIMNKDKFNSLYKIIFNYKEGE